MLTDIVTRLTAVFRSLASAHLQLAQQEASRDISRLIGGVVLLLVATLFAITAWMGGNALVITLLATQKVVTLTVAIAIVFGSNVLLALIVGTIGLRRLRRPVLKETRGLLKKTASALTS